MEDVAKGFRGAEHLAAARPWALPADRRAGRAECDQREREREGEKEGEREQADG